MKCFFSFIIFILISINIIHAQNWDTGKKHELMAGVGDFFSLARDEKLGDILYTIQYGYFPIPRISIRTSVNYVNKSDGDLGSMIIFPLHGGVRTGFVWKDTNFEFELNAGPSVGFLNRNTKNEKEPIYYVKRKNALLAGTEFRLSIGNETFYFLGTFGYNYFMTDNFMVNPVNMELDTSPNTCRHFIKFILGMGWRF